LAEIQPEKRQNVQKTRFLRKAPGCNGLKGLKNNSAINLKNGDKGTTTVIMDKTNNTQEAEVQLEIREHHKPLRTPMVKTTHKGQPDY